MYAYERFIVAFARGLAKLQLRKLERSFRNPDLIDFLHRLRACRTSTKSVFPTNRFSYP